MGTTVDEIEAYYDNLNFKDWTHGISKPPMLKAQHPGFETFMRGMQVELMPTFTARICGT